MSGTCSINVRWTINYNICSSNYTVALQHKPDKHRFISSSEITSWKTPIQREKMNFDKQPPKTRNPNHNVKLWKFRATLRCRSGAPPLGQTTRYHFKVFAAHDKQHNFTPSYWHGFAKMCSPILDKPQNSRISTLMGTLNYSKILQIEPYNAWPHYNKTWVSKWFKPSRMDNWASW